MAEKHQLHLAEYIKSVHLSLRKSSSKLGAEKAWENHCENKDVLTTYSHCMMRLATEHWEVNSTKENNEVISRITWTSNFCCHYFSDKLYEKYYEKDIEIAEKINVSISNKELFSYPLKLLDVGSCYNPFKVFKHFEVLAIDLCPANNNVMECDFLKVPIAEQYLVNDSKIIQLQTHSFEIVTFCFVLEYMPSSEQRIQACKKAYKLLKFGGLLVIATPDSKHVGANCKIMKCWQYTLSLMGFCRIKYEKFKHMHCMAFRKALHKDIAVRWATLHKQSYMHYSINIPQDFSTVVEEPSDISKTPSVYIFNELPFCSNNIIN